MLAQGQSSSEKRGGLAAVSSGLIFLKKKRKDLPQVTGLGSSRAYRWKAKSCGTLLPRGVPPPLPLRLGTPGGSEACAYLQWAVRRVPHRDPAFPHSWEHIKQGQLRPTPGPAPSRPKQLPTVVSPVLYRPHTPGAQAPGDIRCF